MLLSVTMSRKAPTSHRRPGGATLPGVTPLRLRLKELREAKALTQQELADKAGVSRSTIARLETGSLRNATLDMVEKLADALDVNVVVLVDHRPPKRRRPS